MGASKVEAGTGLTFRDKRAATSAPSSFDRALTWPRLQQMLAEAFSPAIGSRWGSGGQGEFLCKACSIRDGPEHAAQAFSDRAARQAARTQRCQGKTMVAPEGSCTTTGAMLSAATHRSS